MLLGAWPRVNIATFISVAEGLQGTSRCYLLSEAVSTVHISKGKLACCCTSAALGCAILMQTLALALQARDLRSALAADAGGPGSAGAPQAMRRSELFHGRWVEDAVLRYLGRRVASGS